VGAVVTAVRVPVAVLRSPFRVLRRRRAPVYVRFLLKGDPPYRQPFQRRWPWRRDRHVPGQVTSLRVLDAALDRLAADPAVKGIVLEVQPLEIASGKRARSSRRLRPPPAPGQ